ncbi:hypothetical protein XCR1_1330021 [Xenorhabdus cabanillasii JM26]|uniref:Uncharacterized protein n=1 Tax=Xenorhabdus cabanillasii JM26 TaxID=1427517 RepID=W1IQY7_9GAMM|nr:hypothetical protein XCR1_1330021 [Xenorhabdus cabanillasii JM26]
MSYIHKSDKKITLFKQYPSRFFEKGIRMGYKTQIILTENLFGLY